MTEQTPEQSSEQTRGRAAGTPVALHAVFTARPGEGDVVAALLRDYGDQVRAEPGNRVFEGSRLRELPDTFFVYEVYDDEAAFQAHLSAAKGEVFNDALGPLITTPTSELTFLTPL